MDDTKVKQSIKNEEDVKSLQEDLNHLYDWAQAHNMVFNSRYARYARYAKAEEIKNYMLYFTENTQK